MTVHYPRIITGSVSKAPLPGLMVGINAVSEYAIAIGSGGFVGDTVLNWDLLQRLVLFVPSRILALPVPKVSAHGFEIPGRLESKLGLGKRRVRRKIRNVAPSRNARVGQSAINIRRNKTSPSADNLGLEIDSRRGPHRFNNL